MTPQQKPARSPPVQQSAPASSPPFIDGDFFESLCPRRATDTDLGLLKPGDLLYAETHAVPALFERIRREGFTGEFSLLTHNSDATVRPAPDGGLLLHLGLGINPVCTRLQLPPNVRHWLGQNLDVPNDARFTSLPIGLERRRWSRGLKHEILAKLQPLAGKISPEHLLYVNHAGNTNPGRHGLAEHFASQPWSLVSGKVPFLDYCTGMLRCTYVLSPDGNGMDCHRTWEALYLGRFPVLRRSTFHEVVYRDLPVLLVDDWTELTEELLRAKAPELAAKRPDPERIGPAYYRKLVASRLTS